jgi:hypothetical protein
MATKHQRPSQQTHPHEWEMGPYLIHDRVASTPVVRLVFTPSNTTIFGVSFNNESDTVTIKSARLGYKIASTWWIISYIRTSIRHTLVNFNPLLHSNQPHYYEKSSTFLLTVSQEHAQYCPFETPKSNRLKL